MADEPKKKKAPRVSPIPGLELVQPETLHLDFKKFKHDELFFISHCNYMAANAKPQPRIVAVTPQAFFICDPDGKMDRATRVEQLESIMYQEVVTKKMFKTTTAIHFVVKIPSEFDVYFSVEDPNSAKMPEMLQVLVNTRTGQKAFTATKLAEGERIQDKVSTEKPEGFLSPAEILEQNKMRQDAMDLTEKVNKESISMRQEMEILTKEVAERGAALRQLEAAMGVDVSDLRKEKDQLAHKQVAIQRDHTTLTIEVAKIELETNNVKDRLREEQSKFDSLVADGIEAAGSNQSVQANELHTLRKKAQTRELNAATSKLDAIKTKAQVMPTYSGADALVARAQKSESEIVSLFQKLERDFKNSDKMSKFFDTMNAELERAGNAAAEKNAEKDALLAEREEFRKKKVEEAKKAVGPAAAAAAGGGGGGGGDLDGLLSDDDDLLGDGPSNATTKPPAAKPTDDLDLDDDLLGDGPSAAPPAAVPAKPSAAAADDDLDLGLDDDLLGDGPGAASAAKPVAPAAAEEEDDGLL